MSHCLMCQQHFHPHCIGLTCLLYPPDLLDTQLQQFKCKGCFHRRYITGRCPNKQKGAYHFTNNNSIYKNFVYLWMAQKRQNRAENNILSLWTRRTGNEPDPRLTEVCTSLSTDLITVYRSLYNCHYNYIKAC